MNERQNQSHTHTTRTINDSDFDPVNERPIARLTICTHAKQREGKTQLGLTAPKPLVVISMDPNTKVLVDKYRRENPEAVIHVKDFTRRPLDLIDDINECKRHWNQIKDFIFGCYQNPNYRSMLLDTGTQMWEDVRFAHVGRELPDKSSEDPKATKLSIERIQPRELGPAKQAVRDVMNGCPDHMNLIITHRVKEEWKDNKPTSKFIRDGMPGIEYLAQVECAQWKDPDSGDFYLRLINATGNGAIHGRAGSYNSAGKYITGADELKNDSITFQEVAMTVYPDSELEDWEG